MILLVANETSTLNSRKYEGTYKVNTSLVYSRLRKPFTDL